MAQFTFGFDFPIWCEFAFLNFLTIIGIKLLASGLYRVCGKRMEAVAVRQNLNRHWYISLLVATVASLVSNVLGWDMRFSLLLCIPPAVVAVRSAVHDAREFIKWSLG